jgi:hypothetical protein
MLGHPGTVALAGARVDDGAAADAVPATAKGTARSVVRRSARRRMTILLSPGAADAADSGLGRYPKCAALPPMRGCRTFIDHKNSTRNPLERR